jgi:hypothetical protein
MSRPARVTAFRKARRGGLFLRIYGFDGFYAAFFQLFAHDRSRNQPLLGEDIGRVFFIARRKPFYALVPQALNAPFLSYGIGKERATGYRGFRRKNTQVYRCLKIKIAE